MFHDTPKMLVLATTTVLLMFSLANSASLPPTESTASGKAAPLSHEEIRTTVLDQINGTTQRSRKGCRINICFAIDGSSSISKKDFQLQKDFILDVAGFISADNPVQLSAVQYASYVSNVIDLTGDIHKFGKTVEGLKQDGGNSFLQAGIIFCGAKFGISSRDANLILVFTDGIDNVGIPGGAEDAAKRARRIGWDVNVVATGSGNENNMLKLAGGNRSAIFEVGSFLDVLSVEKNAELLYEDFCK